MLDIMRRLRGALGNAAIWAASWFAGGFAVSAVLYGAFGIHLPFWQYTLRTAVNLAQMGFLTGGAFSLFLTVAGRRRRLMELSPTRFTMGGALISALLPSALHVAAALVGGVFISATALGVGSAISMVFGGITAWGTLRIAQHGTSERHSLAATSLEGAAAIAQGPPLE